MAKLKSKQEKAAAPKVAKATSRRPATGWRKYLTLILSVVAFLLLNITILGLNYYYSFKVEQATKELNTASKQRDLIQQIAKNLSDINLLAQRDFHTNDTLDGAGLKQAAFRQFDQLYTAQTEFNAALDAFDKGGDLTVDTQTIAITPIDLPKARKSVEQTKELWTPFVGLMDNFKAGDKKGQLTLENISFATDYVRIYNAKISAEMDVLTSELAKRSQNQATTIRIIQVAGLIAALLIFLFIVFRALSQLFRADKQLDIARRETNEIMATINEGLFLVDKDLVIASQYSGRLESIIGQQNLGGKKLPEVLEKIVPKSDLEITETFIEQLYNEWVVADLVDNLNPLQRVRVDMATPNGLVETKYLDFKFNRVYQGEKIERILTSVTDITEAVVLEERLAQERDQGDRQIELLNNILNTDPVMFNSFIQNSQRRVTTVNEILKQPGQDTFVMQEKAQQIFREVHSMKGEASALKFKSFVTACESLEEKVKPLINKRDLTGNDFLGLTVTLNEVMNLANLMASLNDRINQGKFAQSSARANLGGAAVATQAGANRMQKFYTDFASDIAVRNGKSINLVCQGMDDATIPQQQKELLHDVVLQFLRNAIVHGIETPEKRREQGKPEAGLVQLLLTHSRNGEAELIVEDDGAGIDFEAIRNKAVMMGLFSVKDAYDMDKRQLLNLMLSSGFSTAKESTEDAGRGVGTDIIKTNIQQLNGKLKVGSNPGQNTRFTITFPIQ